MPRIHPSRFTTRLALLAFLLATFPARPADQPIARKPPQWLRDGVMYEIYPRNFSPTGDFNGVAARFPELKRLGVTILWFMPIHPIGEKLRKGTLGSPYAVRDYYAIAPELGTTNDFKRLISEAHVAGFKVIIDIVANHTAWDNVLIQQHPEFYQRDATGKIIPPVPEWADVAGLNYANPQLRQYMIGMLKYWLKEFDLDGFRCDVAHMIPTDFWQEARVELEKVKPGIMLLAEASKPDLLVKAFDIDYSWPLHQALNRVLIDGQPVSELKKSWDLTYHEFPQASLHLRISDNHDEARAVARFGIRGALAAQVLIFTLDGVPLIYNGMEVGDATESGDPALFEKMPIFWRPKDRPPLRDIYRDLIKIRCQYPCFRNDRLIWLANSDEKNVLSILRVDDVDEFVVLINFSNRPAEGSVEVLNASEFKPVILAGASHTSSTLPRFQLNSFGWRIFHRQVPTEAASGISQSGNGR